MNNRIEILQSIRKLMSERAIDALIIPSTDPHLGEYVPDRWKTINWLTGFTGSAANVVITNEFAGLWTDSRYFIQAESQLADSGFELVRLLTPHSPEYIVWIAENLHSGSIVGIDGSIFPVGTVRLMRERFDKRDITIDITQELIYELWTDRPIIPSDPAFEHEMQFAGVSRSEKICEVRKWMEQMGVDFHLLTSLDDIAWLLNIRGSDVQYSPLITSFVIIGMEQVLLFVDEEKVPGNLKSAFDKIDITILPYEDIQTIIAQLPDDKSLLISPGTTSVLLFDSIPKGITIIEEITIPTRLKAIKNSVEQTNIRKVMVRDGIALTKFFFWLEKRLGKEKITEVSAAEKLLEFRKEQLNFRGESFATIAGYKEHGALPHYCATEETDVELKTEGIFLLDSGGQYLDGTTDITRTVSLGAPTVQQKTDFTLALKGTIGLAMAKFPYGTRGFQLEILARQALWQHGLNYGHGTGHGVGSFLNVHEGPQTIGTGASGDLKTLIEPGMLSSDEPAIYREGEYGFRTENLILCVEDSITDYGQFLKFDTVTLCYIDISLIERDLLSNEEVVWLNNYHTIVYNRLQEHLKRSEKEWLLNKTRQI